MKQSIKRLSIYLVLILVSGWTLLFFLDKPALLEGVSFSRAVYDEQQHLLRLTLSNDDKYRLYTPLADISPQLVSATLLQEDQYFRWHYGVNPVSMFKAVWQTYVLKSRRMGASTITMQVARIRFGINSKTFSGKFAQIYRAVQLELHYSKNQILEAYLNLAPYGNNIEGVGAASLIYFNKPVKNLNLPESLLLSVIPQNPTQRLPQQKKLKDIRNKLFARWIAQHPEDKSKNQTIDLPLQMQNVRSLPFVAPHFVNEVLQETPEDNKQIITTLNIHTQKILERVTHQYVARKKEMGVYNAVVLLVDTRDMRVKGMVGSADFFNSKIDGQVNGTLALRSPGSTLKPFIYGLALDQGLIHPNTVLKDVPRSFGSYNPENFDYDFVGPIKAKDALVLSRNIPAIYLADQLSSPNLYQFLQKAEIRHLKSESFYGLALVLGGAELSMQELTSLYAMLANDGVWRPLRVRKDQEMSAGNRLLSPEASFLVLDMLKSTPRLLVGDGVKIPVAWKTGTSSGFRDAWTLGVFGPYVMAVWVGNFDNKSNPAFVGKNIAAPLFFELVDALDRQEGPLRERKKIPEQMNLTHIPVCKASGMLPTRYCKDTELSWFIPGKSPIKTDTIHREIAINKNTGLRTCHVDQNTRFEVYEFWPSDLLKIFKQAGVQRRTPPAYDDTCSLAQMMGNIGLAPQITSPHTQLNYILRADRQEKMLIPFSATTDADVVTMYWFVNETYVGNTKREQPFLWNAKAGKFVVRVVDDHARSDARDLVVRMDR